MEAAARSRLVVLAVRRAMVVVEVASSVRREDRVVERAVLVEAARWGCVLGIVDWKGREWCDSTTYILAEDYVMDEVQDLSCCLCCICGASSLIWVLLIVVLTSLAIVTPAGVDQALKVDCFAVAKKSSG